MNLFLWLLSSMLMGGGAAVILVEKRFDWPVRVINLLGRRWLQQNVHRKMHRVGKCSICLSFWLTFFADLAISVLTGGSYWLWPLSGFATAGVLFFLFWAFEAFGRKKPEPTEPTQEEIDERVAVAAAHFDPVAAGAARKAHLERMDLNKPKTEYQNFKEFWESVKAEGIASRTLPFEGDIDFDEEVEKLRKEQEAHQARQEPAEKLDNKTE
jgi:hypothetical protein